MNTREDSDKGLGENRPQINRPQIVMANDINPSLRDNEAIKGDQYTKKYDRKRITIMDRTLADVLDKTLNFIAYSFGDYLVQLKRAELLVSKEGDSKDSFTDRLVIHSHAISLFLSDGDNTIYIGIILIMLSIIIYFINITTS